MKTLITISIILFNIASSFSQGIFSLSTDTVDEMQLYMDMIKTADHYELISEMELQKLNFLLTETYKYFDSASVLIIKAEKNGHNALNLLKKANNITDQSYMLLQKIDSAYSVASAYKDSAYLSQYESDQYYMKLASDYRPVINREAFSFTTYIVLIKTKDISEKYIDKTSDLRTITTANGEKEYIVGQFDSKDEAVKYSQDVARMGYADTYVKSLDIDY
jgi:hypothetical protein